MGGTVGLPPMPQLVVLAVFVGHELVVRAILDDRAMVGHGDVVAELARRQPVADIHGRLVADMPRVDCPKCGVVVARVSWAEPGSRSTRDFESERAWPMSVANQKTVSGFPHVAWRAAGRRRRRVAERLGTAMPSPFDGLAAIGVATMY